VTFAAQPDGTVLMTPRNRSLTPPADTEAVIKRRISFAKGQFEVPDGRS
jgi:hypothetical protein